MGHGNKSAVNIVNVERLTLFLRALLCNLPTRGPEYSAQSRVKQPERPASAPNACTHQLLSQQNLIALVVDGGGRVVGCHAKPSVAMAQHDTLEVPCRHMRGHAGVQQLCGGDAPLRQFHKVDRIDLGHAHIDGAIAVSIDHMGSHARLNLQNGSQNVRVHAMALRRQHEAGVCSQAG